MSTPPPPAPPNRFQLTLRDLLILILSLAAGTATGLLLADGQLPIGQSVVAGCSAFAATIFFLDKIIK
jgi:hypothetical protein